MESDDWVPILLGVFIAMMILRSCSLSVHIQSFGN